LSYWYVLPSLVIAPLLVIQGRSTKKNALRLPEPVGDRKGIQGSGTQLKLLILGDSAGAGVGVEHQRDALSGQIVERLAHKHSLNWSLIATSGDTSLDTIKRLENITAEHFDMVLISLGVNDITSFISQKKWRINCQKLINILLEKFSVKRIIWSDLPKMGKLPALPQPLRWVVGQRRNQFRLTLSEIINSQEKVELLEFPSIFENWEIQIDEWIAQDGYHPNAKLYSLWADVFVEHLNINEK